MTRHLSSRIILQNEVFDGRLALNRFECSVYKHIQVEECLYNRELVVFKLGEIKKIVDQVEQHARLIFHPLGKSKSPLQNLQDGSILFSHHSLIVVNLKLITIGLGPLMSFNRQISLTTLMALLINSIFKNQLIIQILEIVILHQSRKVSIIIIQDY